MNALDRSLRRVSKALAILHEEENERNALVYPVLEGMGLGNSRTTKIDSVDYDIDDEDTIRVDYSWCSRGCLNSEEARLPKQLFLAANPLEAAKAYRAELDETARQARLEEKRMALERLHQELEKEEHAAKNQ